MKTFIVSSALVFLLMMGTSLLAEEAPPWHWDEEETVSTEDKNSAYSEWESDIGW